MRCALLLIFCSLTAVLQATHLVGGNFRVTQVSGSDFDVELIIFRDDGGGNAGLDQSYEVKVYRAQDSVLYSTFKVTRAQRERVKLGDGCFSPIGLNFEEYLYTGDVLLPDLPGGYLLVTTDCCRNRRITNADIHINPLTSSPDNFLTYTAKVPNPALPGLYHSPDLGFYPPTGYFCINYLQSTDLSATDEDGDSLVYELTRPLDSLLQEDTLKVEFLKYEAPYSQNNIIGGDSPLSLDPVTGILTGQPDVKGVFVFSYLVKEYRDGALIGEIRRDIQFHTVTCLLDLAPRFLQPSMDSGLVSVKEESCLDVVVQDSNYADSVSLNSFITSEQNFDVGRFQLASATGTGTLKSQICYEPSCQAVFKNYRLRVAMEAYSEGCDGTDTVSKEFTIGPRSLPNSLDDLLPNIFTPNNDGINDFFRFQNTEVYPCMESLNVTVFNRWGTPVYKSQLTDPIGWDGNFDGREASEGVYYYVITSRYNESDFLLKGHLTLSR